MVWKLGFKSAPLSSKLSLALLQAAAVLSNSIQSQSLPYVLLKLGSALMYGINKRAVPAVLLPTISPNSQPLSPPPPHPIPSQTLAATPELLAQVLADEHDEWAMPAVPDDFDLDTTSMENLEVGAAYLVESGEMSPEEAEELPWHSAGGMFSRHWTLFPTRPPPLRHRAKMANLRAAQSVKRNSFKLADLLSSSHAILPTFSTKTASNPGSSRTQHAHSVAL
ncbi:hypothetical protein PtA15_8A75 [Puccinia triticina]|uniref:CCAAT-binding factor domain-containing protein n=1 Tax=Puccinia triticina TaxID=208348 RepID=A0ABY7CR88_9BASI|nr:uncharacterized protein PtA15_8A75 [Puccinia triticina]WAQ87174.1 hypothetical protein PtA15_8A75 [Puccinia triticina]